MIAASWNVNGLRARIDILSQWIAEARPDVVALQETKVPDEKFPDDAIRPLLGHVIYGGEKSYNGVALLTRREPDEAVLGFEGDESSRSRLVAVRLGDLWVVNTYVPQGYEVGHERFAFKLNWLAKMKEWFAGRFDPARDNVLWMGDLNVAPTELDVYDPKRMEGKVCFSDDEKRALADIVDWGFVDVFRKHEPGEKQFSFFDYRLPKSVDRKLGWRIDHLLATPPLAERSTRAWIDLAPRLRPKPSDHTPICAEFDLDPVLHDGDND